MTAGWNALRRDGWRKAAALIGRMPTPAELYMWLHSVVESGFYWSPALCGLATQIAALGDFDPEHVEKSLAELEKRELLLREGCSLYLPECLRETCAAPSSTNSVCRVARLVMQLGPVLRARVSADLLDVTARADIERARRRKGVKETLFEQLQRELGVRLHVLPQEPQLSLSLPTERPEVRIVKDDTPVETGAFVDFLDAADMKGTHVPAEHQADAGSRRPVAPQERHPAADLRHVADRAATGRESGAGLRAEHGQGSPVAAGREGRAAALLPAAGSVPEGFRVREALRLDVVLAELRKLVPEFALQRKYPSHVLKGEVSTGLPGPLHHAIVEGFTQTQAADPPATMADFLLIGEWVKAGGLHYLPKGEWLAHVCNKLPVALEKAAAWEREGRPDPRGAKSTKAEEMRPLSRSIMEAIVKRRREAANG